MVSRSNDAILVTEFDPDAEEWQIVVINSAFKTLSGFDTSDLINQKIVRLKPDVGTGNWDDVLTAARISIEVKSTLAVKRKDGSCTTLDVDAYPVADQMDFPRYFVLQMTDRSMLDALRANVTKLELILGSMLTILNEPVGIVDPQGRFAAINAAYTRVFGWTMEQLAGRIFSDLVVEEDREEATKHHRGSIASGVVTQDRRVRVQHADGRVLSTRYVSKLVTVAQGETYRVAALTVHDSVDEGRLKLTADEFDRAVRALATTRESGSIVAGTVRMLGFAEIRADLGDESILLKSRADEIVLDVIGKFLNDDDFATSCDDGYVICFARDNASAAEAKIRSIVDAVRSRFSVDLPSLPHDELTFETAITGVKGGSLECGSSILAAIRSELNSSQARLTHNARAQLRAAMKLATVEILQATASDGTPAPVAVARLSGAAHMAARRWLRHLDIDEPIAKDVQLMTFALSARALMATGGRRIDAVVLAPVHASLLGSQAVLQTMTSLCGTLKPGIRSQLGMDIQGLSASYHPTDLAEMVAPYAALGITLALTLRSLSRLHQDLDTAGFRYACIPAPLLVADLASGRHYIQSLVGSLNAQNVTIVATQNPSRFSMAALAKEGIRIFVPESPDYTAMANPEILAGADR